MNRWHVAMFAMALGCAASNPPSPGSQTHFLASCDGDCPAGLECLCGVCTLACDEDAVCEARERTASCSAAPGDAASCDGAARVCDVECEADRDCSALGERFECREGRCRPGAEPPDAGTGQDASADAGTGPGTDAGSICSLPVETGPCDAAISRFYFDPLSNSCRLFTYGGCGGNANNFASRAECEAACNAADACTLPAESGPCEAAIPRYYYDAAAGACRMFWYGGCEGNGNNFETEEECTAVCGNAPLPTSPSCQVGDTVYPSGSTGIDDPTSCNTCSCHDGQLACTDAACPKPCPGTSVPGQTCAQCGPAGRCLVMYYGCLPSCESDNDCLGGVGAGAHCVQGVCQAAGCI